MQRYRTRILRTAVALLLSPILALAQPICKVRMFGTENGLPASVVSGMTQSADNLVWITTWNGLSCYDGYRFTTFRNIPGHDSQLTTNHLVSVMPAADGNLWVTAYSEDVYLFDTRRCQYVNVSSLIARKFHSKFSLRKIYPLASGDTWVVGKYNDHYHMARGGADNADKVKQFRIPGTLNKVMLDKQGNEWLLSDQGAFVYRENGKPRMVTGSWVDFVEETGGMTWLVTKDGQVMKMKDGGKPIRVRLSSKVEKVNEVKLLPGGRLAMATDCGLLVYDTKTGTDRLVSVSWPNNPLTSVDIMRMDSRNRLWCFNDGAGVTMVTPELQAEHLAVATGGDMLTVADKPIFHEDSRHTVWLAPKDGVFSYYDEAKKTLIPQSVAGAGFTGQVIPRAKKGYSDRQGNLWLVYPHNLSLVSFSYSNIQQLDLGVKRDTRSVLQDSEGNIILGTVDGDIAKFSRDGSLLGYLSPSGKWQREKTAFAYHIYSLYEDKKHRLWIGTKGRGLYCVAEGKVTHLGKDDNDAYTLNSDEIYDVKEDTQGRLLVATFLGGLNISQGSIYSGDDISGMRFLNCKNQLKGYVGDVFNKVRRVEVLPGGTVLLSTTQGLLTYQDKFTYPDRIRFYVSRHTQNPKSLYTSEVMQTQSVGGKVYVATLGGGLQCVDAKKLLQDDIEFEPVDEGDGRRNFQLYNNGTIQNMVADGRGNLWVMGESRLACVGKNGIKEYGADEIGGVNVTEGRSSFSALTGRIVVPTEGGAIAFLPQRMDRSSYTPNIVFTSIRYMDNDDERPILNAPRLEVDVDNRSFSLFFSALDYGSHSSVSPLTENCGIRYAYRVDDGEWTYVHPGSNSVSFNNFPAGTHTVSVRSTNGDGVWMDNCRQLEIYAEPTFVESWWGRALIWFAVIAAASFAVRAYMKRRTREITEEAAEKADAGKVRYMLRKPEIVDQDKAFMDKLLAFIEQHISDVDLKVDDMALALGMGRSTFYTRLKQIADMSPSDFLRHVRMKRAEDLIADSAMTFSEVAYAVGFADPKYFGKCFKKHAGKSPSEYRRDICEV